MSATDTYLGLRAFVDELTRCGVRYACTSPGSRSTPLVLSLARDPQLQTSSHIDERCAAFFALGQAKQSGLPTVLTCTSGTAAANFTPAVFEAHEARVPLIVLTADRPPELRAIGAGQSIDQLKLYGSAAKWFFDVDDHPATPERMRWLRQLGCRAFWTAVEGRPGVVHLNFALREPLVLEEGLSQQEPGGGGRHGGRPWVARPRTMAAPWPALTAALKDRLARSQRPVLVAGRMERDAELPSAVARFAENAGIPLLADPLSGARRGPAAIAHYDAMLRDQPWASSHVPDLVLRCGDLPTSKPLRQWLRLVEEVGHVVLDPDAAWQDPGGSAGEMIAADPRLIFEALTSAEPRSNRSAWTSDWTVADRRASSAIAEVLSEHALNEPRVAAELGSWLPASSTLVVASSMPVRDVETFFPARADPPRVLSNRGANGIDGTVSTAFGVAAASSEPVVLLIGDVALAYDIGGLLAARRVGAPLVIVLLNNNGGGIFSFLPVSKEGDDFERHVATPHGLDFSHAAALYGCEFQRVETPERLRAGVRRALEVGGTTIVEVVSEREANVQLHQRVWETVGRSVSAV